ncbi:hypothetical protein [Enterococcus sp. LJL90]
METWAIVCGAVRDELELRLTMDELLVMRKENLIQGIIISTWENEFDNFKNLKEELLQNDVDIIEIMPLEKRGVVVDNTNSLNYFRQSLQMQAALDKLPKDCVILKARTDRAIHHLNLIKPYLKDFEGTARIEEKTYFNKKLPKIFEYQMVVLNAKTQRIFNFSDFVFLAYANDVRKLMNFDISEFYFGRDLVANTQWFIYPFLREFPVLREYFCTINFRPLIPGMRQYLERVDKPVPLPHFFYRVYGCYLIILNHYFRIVDMLHKEPVGTTHFVDLFADAKDKGLVHTPLGTILLNDQVVKNFLEIDGKSENEMDKLFVEHLNSESLYDKLTDVEFAELVQFRDSRDWLSVRKWLRARNWRDVPKKQKREYSGIFLSYKFAELSDQENAELLIELKNQESVDRYLYQYWFNRSYLGAESAMQMVFPLARTRVQEPILILSRLLRLNKIKSTLDQTSIIRIIEGTFEAQRQRNTFNIKSCQLMINLIIVNLKNKNIADLYSNTQVRIILDRYLEKKEFLYVTENKLSLSKLVAYLKDLSGFYERIGRLNRSLRLLELATEFDLTEENLNLLLMKYSDIGDKKNTVLSQKAVLFLK